MAVELRPWEQLGELEEYGALVRQRLEHLVPVREPLVLCSQIQRSGGTLLSQLFDGHPQLHAHPGEVYIGHPKKWDWPRLVLTAPETWFATLYEGAVDHWRAIGGFRKGKRAPDLLPVVFSPVVQKRIFERCVDEVRPASERGILDCFFTSYFNAWLDNHNLYTGPKRAVSGFTPRLAMRSENVEAFFSAYPDGMLVSIVRDPRAWYASASRHKGRYREIEPAVALWRASAEAALEAQRRHGDRVVVLTYERLVTDTRLVMAALAERIGIEMHPSLLTPTFNGMQIRSNSVDRGARSFGVSSDRIEAFRSALDGETTARITASAGDVYERAAAAGEQLTVVG